MTEVMRLCITQRQRRTMIMSSIMSSIIIRISVIMMKRSFSALCEHDDKTNEQITEECT